MEVSEKMTNPVAERLRNFEPKRVYQEVHVATLLEAALEIDRLTAENERLSKALEPFARASNFFAIQNMKDDQIVLVKPSDAGLSGALTAKDFRRAASALSGDVHAMALAASNIDAG